MKLKLLILLFSFLAITPPGCHKKVEPNFPPGVTPAHLKVMQKMWGDGEQLYKSNCASCHGIFTKGKQEVPNFSTVQIDQYASRFLLRDPKNHAVMRQMSQPDFDKIIFFLKYIKSDKPKKAMPPQRNLMLNR
jgi:hypothetical protein